MNGLALESALVIALIVVVSVALATRWVRLPYTLALVVIGLLLGSLNLVPEVELTPDLILLVFLPPLLFAASYQLDVTRLRRDLPAIALLAIPGVLVGAVLIALVVSSVLNLSFETALVFGSLVAATDPVSVLAIFSRLGAPERLTTIIEGESLFNDGIAIVVYGIVIEAALGGHVSLADGMAEFITVAIGGAAVGLLTGVLATALLQRIDDHLIEITITTAAAFGAYTLGETLHVSGVIAVVIAGLLVGTLRSVSMSPTTRLALGSFWDYVAFLGNSMIFLLMGMRIAAPELWSNIPSIALVMLAVIGTRGMIVGVVNAVLRTIRQEFPWTWVPVVTWGGLRGAVSLALALSLPRTLDDRAWIQIATFGVVLVSLLGQGLTMPLLLAQAGFRGDRVRQHERHLARLQAYSRALSTIEAERQRGRVLPDVADAIREEYEQAIEAERAALSAEGIDRDTIRRRQLLAARRHALMIQRDTFVELRREGRLGTDAFTELSASVNSELEELESDDEST